MTKYYQIAEKNFDYNDETYYQTDGYNKPSSIGYKTRESAQKHLEEHIKEKYKDYSYLFESEAFLDNFTYDKFVVFTQTISKIPKGIKKFLKDEITFDELFEDYEFPEIIDWVDKLKPDEQYRFMKEFLDLDSLFEIIEVEVKEME